MSFSRIVTASGQVTDWRLALLAYAGQRGLDARPDEHGVELWHPAGQGTIRVDLDERGRVVNVAGHLEPTGPAPKRRGFGRRKD